MGLVVKIGGWGDEVSARLSALLAHCLRASVLECGGRTLKGWRHRFSMVLGIASQAIDEITPNRAACPHLPLRKSGVALHLPRALQDASRGSLTLVKPRRQRCSVKTRRTANTHEDSRRKGCVWIEWEG